MNYNIINYLNIYVEPKRWVNYFFYVFLNERNNKFYVVFYKEIKIVKQLLLSVLRTIKKYRLLKILNNCVIIQKIYVRGV